MHHTKEKKTQKESKTHQSRSHSRPALAHMCIHAWPIAELAGVPLLLLATGSVVGLLLSPGLGHSQTRHQTLGRQISPAHTTPSTPGHSTSNRSIPPPRSFRVCVGRRVTTCGGRQADKEALLLRLAVAPVLVFSGETLPHIFGNSLTHRSVPSNAFSLARSIQFDPTTRPRRTHTVRPILCGRRARPRGYDLRSSVSSASPRPPPVPNYLAWPPVS